MGKLIVLFSVFFAFQNVYAFSTNIFGRLDEYIKDKHISIAVISEDGDSDLASKIEQAFMKRYKEKISVIDRKYINKILIEYEINSSDLFHDKYKVGNFKGIDYVCLIDKYSIRLINIETLEVISAQLISDFKKMKSEYMFMCTTYFFGIIGESSYYSNYFDEYVSGRSSLSGLILGTGLSISNIFFEAQIGFASESIPNDNYKDDKNIGLIYGARIGYFLSPIFGFSLDYKGIPFSEISKDVFGFSILLFNINVGIHKVNNGFGVNLGYSFVF